MIHALISQTILEKQLKIRLQGNVKARNFLLGNFDETVLPNEREERIISQALLMH